MNHAINMYKYHLWANKVLLERIKNYQAMSYIKKLIVHIQILLKRLAISM